LPGVKVAIANPKTRGQCADTHLGEVLLLFIFKYLFSLIDLGSKWT